MYNCYHLDISLDVQYMKQMELWDQCVMSTNEWFRIWRIYDKPNMKNIIDITLSNTIDLLLVKKMDDQVLIIVYCISVDAT
jgi:hypothetical protein